MKLRKLLIINDDNATLDTLNQWLCCYHHYKICTARSSDEALDHMQHQAFDAIITDINHPGIDGLTLTRLLSKFGGPPVIITTGYPNQEYLHKAYANGAHACLRKPYNLEEVRKVVNLVADKGVHYIGRRG